MGEGSTAGARAKQPPAKRNVSSQAAGIWPPGYKALAWSQHFRKVVTLLDKFARASTELAEASADKRQVVRQSLQRTFVTIRATLTEAPGGKVLPCLQYVLSLLVDVGNGKDPEALVFMIREARVELARPLGEFTELVKDVVDPVDAEWPSSASNEIQAKSDGSVRSGSEPAGGDNHRSGQRSIVLPWSRHRRVSEWIDVFKLLGEEMSEDTFLRRRTGKAVPSYRVNPTSRRGAISLCVDDLPSGYTDTPVG